MKTRKNIRKPVFCDFILKEKKISIQIIFFNKILLEKDDVTMLLFSVDSAWMVTFGVDHGLN